MKSGGCVCEKVELQDANFVVDKGETADASLGHFTNFPISSEVHQEINFTVASIPFFE